MTASFLAGGLIGLGVLLLVLAFQRPVPGVAATLGRIDGTRLSLRARAARLEDAQRESPINQVRDGLGDLLLGAADRRGWQLNRTRRDLAVMNRSLQAHLGTKALLAVLAFFWLPVVVTLSGLVSGFEVPVGLALLAGVLGFVVPDLALHSEAERRRTDFRHVVGAFLDLVAMNLAGGRGLPEALVAASSFGDHWAMARLRQALSNARIMGWTPWEGVARLAEDLGIDELRDLASALALAGDEGARIRMSLMSRAESMRRKELVDVEGAAGESSQSMLVAQLLMCIAFLVFLAYPAVSQLGS